jgi:xanthosine utilization system XapX-like protein
MNGWSGGRKVGKNKELWLAIVAMLLIGGLYGLVTISYREVPAASGLFGHLIGVLGFILMLMTELLYSLRKRSRTARWGRMSDWLAFHIFTGLVGPFMVLLHSSWKFQGLAGAVMLMTVVIVVSGFIGRYIYTAVPRTVDGAEIQESMLEESLADMDAEVKRMERFREAGEEKEQEIRQRMELLKKEREKLKRQVGSLVKTRRRLAIWHTVHIPLGMALFTAAFIPIGAALYYATLLH